ncbi:MAG: RsmF rRNA methyltransferase first C-terminal domain-containing protein [Chloroflexota bacterium]|nr:RsmF rRNA methyltransferase first C-terminal domain-containing protein [Chloroflexota bacterium]
MQTYDYPQAFVTRMTGWLGGEAADFFAALAQPETGLRLNPRRGAPEELAAALPWQTEPIPWCPLSRCLRDSDVSAGRHPYHQAGLYYIQDPTAMAAAVLLDPQPGEWVLDLAAAPGGKASHIAARMGNEGVLVANDIARRRVSVLAMNLERLGVTNALVANETPSRLAERWPALFDAVLVDAPCSGEGMFSRDRRIVRAWSLESVQAYAARQREILAESAPLVAPGGRLLYGTCTFSPEENEGVIAAFLAQHPNFELLPLPTLPGLRPGQPAWINAPALLRRAGRFWPHTGPGHGHFYALLRRHGQRQRPAPQRWRGQSLPAEVLARYRQQLAAVLSRPPPESGLFLNQHNQLYSAPIAPEGWRGLHVMRPGWWLATAHHGRIDPDHALAMALSPVDTRATCELSPADPRIVKYLRGGFWPDAGPAGLVLVTVGGYPLGWAKRGGGRLHSRYPKHLRR